MTTRAGKAEARFMIRLCAEGEHKWLVVTDVPRYTKKVCEKCGLIEELTVAPDSLQGDVE